MRNGPEEYRYVWLLLPIVLFGPIFLFGDAPEFLWFLSWYGPPFLIITIVSTFLTYVYLLKKSPIYAVKKIVFAGGDGFVVIDRNNQEVSIDYQKIIEFHCETYQLNMALSRFDSSVSSNELSLSRHFWVQFHDQKGNVKTIALSPDIADLYKAIAIIVGNIPSEKRGNVRLVGGKIGVDRTTSYFGRTVDLDTKKGKIVLVAVAVVVAAIWLVLFIALR